MKLHTILTVKQPAFEAILHSLRIYVEQDECVCERYPELPLFAQCPPDCDHCMWCIGRTALRGIGQRVDAQNRGSEVMRTL